MSERPNCNRQMGRSNPPAGSTSQEAMGHFLSDQFPDGSLSPSILDSSKNALDLVFGLQRLETMRHGAQRPLFQGIAETSVHESI